MGKKSSGGGSYVPKPEDYLPLIQEQARQNRVNTYTPYGYTEFTQIGGAQPVAPVATTTAPPTTASREMTEPTAGARAGSRVASNFAERLGILGISVPTLSTPAGATPNVAQGDGGGSWQSVSGFSPEVQSVWDQQLAAALDPYAFNQDVADAAFNKAWGYLQPIQEQQTSRLEQQLADRGLPIGQEAYNDATSNLYRNQAQQQEQAALAALLAGENSAGNAYNRLAGITGRGTVTPATPIDVTSAANLAQQASLANAQNQSNKKSSTANAGATLGAAYLLSDENVKDMQHPADVQEILEAFEDIRLDYWYYQPWVGDTAEHIGTYAQDFQEAFGVGDGKTISPIDAIGVLMAAVKAMKARIDDLERVH